LGVGLQIEAVVDRAVAVVVDAVAELGPRRNARSSVEARVVRSEVGLTAVGRDPFAEARDDGAVARHGDAVDALGADDVETAPVEIDDDDPVDTLDEPAAHHAPDALGSRARRRDRDRHHLIRIARGPHEVGLREAGEREALVERRPRLCAHDVDDELVDLGGSD
jgi:hypothetical protein